MIILLLLLKWLYYKQVVIFRLNLEKAVFKLTQNLTWKLQFTGFLFSGRVVPSYCHHCLFSTLNFLSVLCNVFNLFISRTSGTFFIYMFDIPTIVLGWIQLNCSWHYLVCLVATDDSKLPFVLSCWYSMQRVNTFFFDWPIYQPLLEQSNWCTPGWLLGSSYGLFWHRMFCKFLPELTKHLKENIRRYLILDQKLGKNFKKQTKTLLYKLART